MPIITDKVERGFVSFFEFGFYFVLAIPIGAQDLLLALYSGITPGRI